MKVDVGTTVPSVRSWARLDLQHAVTLRSQNVVITLSSTSLCLSCEPTKMALVDTGRQEVFECMATLLKALRKGR